MTYDLKPIRTPRLTGAALKTLVRLLENDYAANLIRGQLQREFGLRRFRETQRTEPPTAQPWHAPGRAPSREKAQQSMQRLTEATPAGSDAEGFQPTSVSALAAAYRNGTLNPEQIAERLLGHIATSNQAPRPLRAVIAHDEQDLTQQARYSAKLLREGRPRSLLEGVPVAIKDEFDALPYSTCVGTRCLESLGPCQSDATTVARLRAAGALIIGKTNMHEVGIGVTGINPHHGACRNPYDPDRAAGGSSGGSASAVAGGLCPLSLGADGGGSIRIPAALCGVVGLKPTWGRVSEHGAFPLCWSVAHAGPIGATVDDVALGYVLMAGPDSNDPWTLQQPHVHLQDYYTDDLKGLKVGIYRPWLRDADAAVVAINDGAIKALEAQGATVHEIELPNLDDQRIAHAITITSEMRAALAPHLTRHRQEFALDSRLNLAMARSFTAMDYVQAQRVRTQSIRSFLQALDQVDVIVTPTTAITAPKLRADALASGESDTLTMSRLMQFCTPANFNGLPALTVPAGYDPEGMPVGVQLMGRPWEEHLILRMGRVIEAAVPRQRPAVYYDLREG